MLQKLDRYVSSYFISSYGVCLLFFVGMFVLIDLFAKSDDILARAGELGGMGYSAGFLTVQYYALQIPFIFLQVAPFVTVMAAMFAISRLRRNNELVPMIVSGRSIFRVLTPVFVFASVLASGMVLVQQFVAPPLADARERVRSLLLSGKEERRLDGFYFPSREVCVHVEDYNIATKNIGDFDVSELGTLPPAPPMIGKNAQWNSEHGAFEFAATVPDGLDPKVTRTETRSLPARLTPDIIESVTRGPYDLSYSQILYLFQNTDERTRNKWKVLLHYHLTFPLSNVLLLMLGLPFVLRQETRSHLLGMMTSILICAAYFSFDAVMRNLGEQQALHPVLAAWFGVIFFGSLGVILIDNVKT